MTLDLRIPIGLLFGLLGLLLAVYGAASDKGIYAASLGINVNLWWGLVMFVFGALMLIGARRASTGVGTESPTAPNSRTDL
jgi:hypothetical protein